MPLSLPMKLYYDNKSASIANNLVLHDRTKHIELDKQFINEKVEDGTMCILVVPSMIQAAHVFTKGLLRQPFEVLVSKLGMTDIFAPTWGKFD